MNFFNVYGRATHSFHQNQLILGAIVFVMLAAAAFGTVQLHGMRTTWSNKIAPMVANAEAATSTKANLDTAQAKLEASQRLYDTLEAIDNAINHVNFFTADDARTIIAAMPKGVTVETFSLSGISLNITGMLDNIATLPSLSQDLENTGLFISVIPKSASSFRKVSSSAHEEGGDPFDYVIMYEIECILKGEPLR